MPLAAGTNLGPYEIIGLVGAGGMGEVYRARDKRLDRTVAIKVAAAQFSERFEREARTVASLNHPNICTLHDIGPNWLVMEFVEGQTLERLIPPGGMRLAEAIKIATGIASGLAAAHAQGIIHRDLKPGNVMVTPAGAVKLLDFGLATLEQSAPAQGVDDETRTITGPKTAEGAILGTVAYMSPEQAEGRKLDARSDIFSFGSVLYQMLTGRRAFRGDTGISTLAAILNQEPAPVAELLPALPVELERILTRCLRKDPERRFQHSSDLRVELQEISDALSSGILAKPSAARPRSAGKPVAAAAALALAAGAGGWFLHQPPPAVVPAPITRATFDQGLTCDPALSFDGKLLAYASDRAGHRNLDIWVQSTAGDEPVQLTRDDADEAEPSFSPDGSRIVFRSERNGGGIYVVPALGGEARLVAREGRNPRFSPDGSQIAYWTGKGGRNEALARQGGRLFIIPAGGGEPRQLAADVGAASTPIWSPDGTRILFVGWMPRSRDLAWYLAPAAGGAAVPVDFAGVLDHVRTPTPAHWLPSNQIVLSDSSDDAKLFRAVLDPGSARLRGPGQQVTFGSGSHQSPSVAGDGSVALASLTRNFDLWELPLDANQGRVTGEPVRLTDSLLSEHRPTLSADGQRLTFISARGNQQSLWFRDLRTGKDLSLVRGQVGAAVISSDGSRAAYGADGKIFIIPIAEGLSQTVCADCGGVQKWTPSGHLVYAGRGATGKSFVLDPGTRQSRLLLDTTSDRIYNYKASFSKDEKWVVFTTVMRDLLSARVHVAPTDGPWPIPRSAWIPVSGENSWDDKPLWSPDESLIYFTSDRDGYRCVWAQRVDPRSKRPVGPPFAVTHSHSSRQSILNVGLAELEIAVAPGRLVFVQGELAGNIWLTKLP